MTEHRTETQILEELAHRLGRAHHGRRVTRHTMRSIARACPECKEST